MLGTRRFAEIGKGDAHIAGGKGASLGEMTRAGIPVPPGFVVVAGAFDAFVEENRLAAELDAILDTVNIDEMHTVEHASERIQALVLSAKMPADIAREIMEQFRALGAEFVAVRSSATAEDGSTAAWAGQLDTFLNTTEDRLLENVQRCFASLFTPRAIFYRKEKGMHTQKVSVAVVVQKMVQSELSGIAFSVHPVTEDYNQIIIEAGFGLGEAIVSGQVTPDSYVVEKSPQRIIEKNISTQTRMLTRALGHRAAGKTRDRHSNMLKNVGMSGEGANTWVDIPEPKASSHVLSDVQVLELAELILRIENHYGFPCDIEWAYENGTFYITQSRPITTLAPKATSFVEGPAAHYFNTKLVKMGRWALAPLDTESWMTEATARYFAELFGFPKGILCICTLDDDFMQNYVPQYFFDQLYGYIDRSTKEDFLALSRKLKTFYELKKKLIKAVSKISDCDPAKLDTHALVDRYAQNREWLHRATVYDQFGWIGENYWEPHMQHLLERAGLKRESPEYHKALFALTKPEHISTTLCEKREVLRAAVDIRKGTSTPQAEIARLVADFAWLPVFAYGTPWGAPHFQEELQDLSERSLAELTAGLKPLDEYAKRRNGEFAATVAQLNLSDHEAQVFVDFGLMLDVRNEAEYLVSFCGFHVLPFYDEIARRLGISVRELRNLFEEDIIACLKGEADAKTLFKDKGSIIAWGFDPAMQKRSNFSPEDSAALFEYAERTSTIIGETPREAGVCASVGKAKGRAKIVVHPGEQHKVEAGDILITHATTVDYLPSMKKAAAIVTEVGGLTCHAAVVSREFGVPCVVSLKKATKTFKDGDVVEVDADNGVVRVIERAYENGTFYITQSRPITTLARHDSSPRMHIDPVGWVAMKSSASPLILGFNVPSWTRLSVDRYGTIAPLKEMIALYVDRGDVVTIGVRKDDYIASAKHLFEQRGVLQRIIKDFHVDKSRFMDLVAHLNDGTVRIEDSFEKFMAQYAAMYSSGIMLDGFLMFSDVVVASIYTKYSADDIADIESLLETPQLHFAQEEELGILRIAQADESRQTEMLRLHQMRYHWVLNNYKKVAKLPLSYFTDRLNDIRTRYSNEEIKERCVRLENHAVSHAKCVEQIRGKNRLREQDIQDLLLFGSIASLIDARKACNLIGNHWIGEYIAHAAAERNLDEAALLLLTPSEFEAVMHGCRNLSDISTHARIKKIAAHYVSDEVELYEGPDADIIQDMFSLKVDTHITEVRGVAAFRGHARGTVKVLEFPAQKEFHAGEILVTSMTRPDFVPLMKRAGAVVTDEGGVTSHAAIIARELEKPCVIGTKIATQVLKDGDLVEVDADNGVVRVIERATADITSVDWHLYLRRQDQPPFFNSFWLQVEGPQIRDLIGGGFTKQLCLREGDDSYWLRSSSDFANLRAGVRAFVEQSSHEELRVIFDEAARQQQVAKSLLANIASYTPAMILKHFDELIATLDGILLYTTSVPYMFLDMLEHVDTTGLPHVEYIREQSDLLRSASSYRPLKTEVLDRAIAAFAGKFGITFSQAASLTQEEMQCALKTGVLSQTSDDLDRREHCVYWTLGGDTVFSCEPRVIEHMRRIAKPSHESDTEVKGSIAFKGKVRGTVRIVTGEKDMHRVAVGDIMVAHSTNPAVVPAMHRAAAFVTDEGGIASHAAILARELKKPCIIGTKVATQVLKDGDLVEVDANAGIVRIMR